MQNLINPDNALMQFISKLVSSVWLNILWFICCIPVITIGPATTALFYCCHKLADDSGGYVTRNFFHSFRENFRQGTFIGIIMTVLGIFIGIDGYVLYHLHADSAFWTILTAVYFVATAAYLIVLMYIFALLAYFNNSTIAMFKNSLVIGMRFLLCTALMALIYFTMFVVVVRLFTPCIIFGMGTCALFCSMLLKNIFLQCRQADSVEGC